VNDLHGQGNAMRVVLTLEALRKVANPSSFGAAAAGAATGDVTTANPPATCSCDSDDYCCCCCYHFHFHYHYCSCCNYCNDCCSEGYSVMEFPLFFYYFFCEFFSFFLL